MCVLFIFVKLKRPQDAERGKPARFVCGEGERGMSHNITDSLTVGLSEQ